MKSIQCDQEFRRVEALAPLFNSDLSSRIFGLVDLNKKGSNPRGEGLDENLILMGATPMPYRIATEGEPLNRLKMKGSLLPDFKVEWRKRSGHGMGSVGKSEEEKG